MLIASLCRLLARTKRPRRTRQRRNAPQPELLKHRLTLSWNITGQWQGTLTEPDGGTQHLFDFSMDLTQSGDNVQGTDTISWITGTYFADIELSGILDNSTNVFIFQETSITQQNPPPGAYWLIKSGSLQMSVDGSSMSGPWVSGSYGGTISLSGQAAWIPLPTPNVVLSSAPDASEHGQSVTLTAVVSPPTPDLPTPTGTVTFMNGSTDLGIAHPRERHRDPVGQQSAGWHGRNNRQLSWRLLIRGEHVVNVGRDRGTGRDIHYCQLLGRSVERRPGRDVHGRHKPYREAEGAPSGTVTFMDGTTPLGTVVLSGGIATYSTNALAHRFAAISANYNGDMNFRGDSASLKQIVSSSVALHSPTKTTVRAIPRPATVGRPVTVTATVRARRHGGGTPAGSVTILDGTAALGTVPLVSGRARLTAPSLPIGRNVIRVEYVPVTSFGSSSASVVETVRPHRSRGKPALP